MTLRDSNLQLEAITATVTKTVLSDGAVMLQCTASSSLVITVTASVQQGGTFTTIPVVNYKTGVVDADGASISVASGDILYVNTPGLAEVKITVDSGTGTLQMRRWDEPIEVNGAGQVGILPTGVQCYSFIADATDELLISASARKLWGVDVFSIDATPVYVKLYDKATAPSESDTPVHRTGVPANATAALGAGSNKGVWPNYVALTAGLGVRAVTGIADSNDAALTGSEVIVNVYWSV